MSEWIDSTLIESDPELLLDSDKLFDLDEADEDFSECIDSTLIEPDWEVVLLLLEEEEEWDDDEFDDPFVFESDEIVSMKSDSFSTLPDLLLLLLLLLLLFDELFSDIKFDDDSTFDLDFTDSTSMNWDELSKVSASLLLLDFDREEDEDFLFSESSEMNSEEIESAFNSEVFSELWLPFLLFLVFLFFFLLFSFNNFEESSSIKETEIESFSCAFELDSLFASLLLSSAKSEVILISDSTFPFDDDFFPSDSSMKSTVMAISLVLDSGSTILILIPSLLSSIKSNSISLILSWFFFLSLSA